MSGNPIAWHYTTGDCARGILSDGVIRPATAFVPAGEIPIVWFSTHPTWEPTARKAVTSGNNIIVLSAEDTMRRCNGGWRFGLPTDQLIYFRKLTALCRMTRQEAKRLEAEGKRQGANPADWWGTTEPVSAARCIVQEFAGGSWIAKVEIL